LPSHYHAVAWIDHREARVIYFNEDDADEKIVHPVHAPHHLHSTAGSAGGMHEKSSSAYFRDIADTLREAKAFLVTGPSSAKNEFVTWLRKQAPSLAKQLCGIETSSHQTKGQLVAEARRFFKGEDRMRPQRT
jgi:stalled ribosome rescue protein Dom34